VSETPELSVWRAISTKRAVREFSARPLDPDHLDRILRAGRRSGSSKNLQRWEFVLCRDREHLGELSAVGPYAGHLAGAAVAIALVTPKSAEADDPLSVMFDLGQAAAYMMLAAWELGIGSVPATVYEPDLARRLLGYLEPPLRIPAVVRISSGRDSADGAESTWSTSTARGDGPRRALVVGHGCGSSCSGRLPGTR
jgi:nitroreductase